MFKVDLLDFLDLKYAEVEFWRMNLIAISEISKFIFIALKEKIIYYDTYNNGLFKQNQSYKILKQCGEEELVNQILMKKHENKEFMGLVDMNAKVTIFNMSPFNQIPLFILNNSDPLFLDNSTWSLDFYLDKNVNHIICGSNNKKISMWDFTDIKSDNLPRKQIDAHEHNIPCVSYSPCGSFIASTSIDKMVKIFLSNGREICNYKLTGWGWSVLWIAKKSIENYRIYKSNAQKEKKKDLENPIYLKKSLNYQLNKYLLLITMNSSFILIDPIGDKVENLINENIKPFQMKKIKLHNISLPNYSRLSIIRFSNILSLFITASHQNNIIYFHKIFYEKERFSFALVDSNIILNGIIFGVDLIEKKGISSELDDCKIYILYRSNNGNLVSVYNVKSINDLIGYSLINTFI